MPIQLSGATGPQVLQDGAQSPVRQGKAGELVVQEFHGRYYEQTYRGNTFLAANSAVTALSLGSTTATGLILSNPLGSGKNLSILEIQCWLAAAVTAVANIAVFANVNPVATATTHTTPLVVRPTLLGTTNVAVGLADSAATWPVAPVIVRPLSGWSWVTAGTSMSQVGVKDEVAGALAVAPGCTLSIQAVTVAHSVLASVTWEEIPVQATAMPGLPFKAFWLNGWPIYTDAPSGTLIFQGSTVEAKVNAESPTGVIIFGGAANDAKTGAISPTGAIIFGGSVVQTKIGAISPTGAIIFTGLLMDTDIRTHGPILYIENLLFRKQP